MLIGGGYVICVASVWNKEKGFDDIIQLRELVPLTELIVIVGVTANQKKLLPKGIIGVERTSNIQELAMLYAGADVFVNPTWGDNFPTVNIEALACATPVITYNTGGSPEAVDSKCGSVVAQGDIKGITKSIMRIKGDREFYSPAHCRIKALRDFNKLMTYHEYISLYNNILRKK